MRSTTRTAAPLSRTRRRLLLGIAGGAAQIAGCGGGGGNAIAGISTGGTGSFTVGPITGFGSIIVNGIRFDDSAAQVTRLDGGPAGSLGLGTMVSIEGSTISGSVASGTATATANRIVSASEWRGRVDAVAEDASSLTLLGQTVRLSPITIFEGAGVTRASDLRAGLYAEVHGFVDPVGARLEATRVELSISRPDSYRLSGLVTASDPTRFAIGAARIGIGGATATPPAVGSFVRVTLGTTQDALGVWPAIAIDGGAAASGPIRLEDDDEAELRGSITALTNSTQFALNGIPVDASGVPGAAMLGLTVGVIVKVEGRVRGGVVFAEEIEIEDTRQIEATEFEIHGTVEQLNTTLRTFVARGYVFTYDTQTAFDLEGAPWRNGLTVEVKAIQREGRLYAIEIETD